MKRMILPVAVLMAALFTVLLSYSAPLFQKAFPSAQNGAVDLSAWNFEKDGPVSLSGAWECYDGQLLTPADFAGNGTQTPHLTGCIPLTAGRLNNPSLKPIRPKGIRTYRLVVRTDGADRNYGLRIANIRMSSRVYVDGHMLGTTGTPAPAGRGYQPRGQSNVVYFRSQGRRMEILIQVANYDYPFYGTQYSIFLGLQNQVTSAMVTSATSELCGGLLAFLFGFLYFCLFRMRKSDRSMLFATLEFWSIAGIELTFGEKPLYLFWPSIPFELFGKIQSLALMTMVLSIIAFAKSVHRAIFPGWFTRACYTVGVAYCLCVLATPNSVYVRLNGVCDALVTAMLAFLLARLLRLYRTDSSKIQKSETRLNIFCVTALIIALGNAFLYTFSWIPNTRIGSLAAMSFFLLSIGSVALRIQKSNDNMLRSELALLQEQIKPHFIYNAINTIVSFCYSDGERAAKLLTNFSRYLRLTVSAGGQSLVEPLGREIERIRAYVEIEQARFGDRIRVRYDVDPALLNREIPALIIQPLVENAIKHGLRPKPEGGLVVVSIRELHGVLTIRVQDTGVGMPPEMVAHLRDRENTDHGVGLHNVSRRVDHWPHSHMEIHSVPGCGTDISIMVKHFGAMQQR